jgi:hypothetical protein
MGLQVENWEVQERERWEEQEEEALLVTEEKKRAPLEVQKDSLLHHYPHHPLLEGEDLIDWIGLALHSYSDLHDQSVVGAWSHDELVSPSYELFCHSQHTSIDHIQDRMCLENLHPHTLHIHLGLDIELQGST